MISASAGTICTSRMQTMNALRPRNRNRDTATAARKAMNSDEHQHEQGDGQAVLHRRPEEVALEDLAVVGERAR